MRKRVLAMLLCLLFLAGFIPALAVSSYAITMDELNSSTLLGSKQPANSKLCAVYACWYMTRRRLAIEENSLQAGKNLSYSSFKAVAASGVSLKDSFTYTYSASGRKFDLQRIDLDNSGSYNMQNLSKKYSTVKEISGGKAIRKNGKTDVEKLSEILMFLLDKRPEGIEIFGYVDSGHQHCVLVTHYKISSTTGKPIFYCADPAPGASKTPITLKSSTISGSLGCEKTQDAILQRVAALWFVHTITKGTNTNIEGWSSGQSTSVPEPTTEPEPTADPTPTPVLTPTAGEYRLRCGDLYLTASSDKNGGNVKAAALKSTGKTQVFVLKKSGSYYTFKSAYSDTGRMLNVYTDGTSASGNNVTLWESTGHATQKWKLEASGNGFVLHPSDNDAVALAVDTNDSNNVCLKKNSGGAKQLWFLESTVEPEEPSHVHSLLHQEAINSTCTSCGEPEYWYCEDCGDVFSDASGQTPLDLSVVAEIPSDGHDMEFISASGPFGYWHCKRCDGYFIDKEGSQSIVEALTMTAASTTSSAASSGPHVENVVMRCSWNQEDMVFVAVTLPEESDIKGVLIVALYSENDQLLSSEAVTADVSSGETKVNMITLQSAPLETDYAKVYFLSENDCVPLCSEEMAFLRIEDNNESEPNE